MTLVGAPIFFVFLVIFSVLVYFSADLQRTAGQFLCVVPFYLFSVFRYLQSCYRSKYFPPVPEYHVFYNANLLPCHCCRVQIRCNCSVCCRFVFLWSCSLLSSDISYPGIVLLATIIYMYVGHLLVTHSRLMGYQGI